MEETDFTENKNADETEKVSLLSLESISEMMWDDMLRYDRRIDIWEETDEY